VTRGLSAALAVLLLAWSGAALAQPAGGGAPGPRTFTPFDPAKEPAIRGEQELRKGAAGVQSGDDPLPGVVKKVGPGLFEVGTIALDLNTRQARVPGRINMTRGIIEYLAVMDGRGKLHESVLALDVQPSLLQLALILLGLEPGELAPGDPVARTPPRLVKRGDPVVLWVEWRHEGKTTRVLADTLVFNRETQKPLAGNTWNFTGSFFAPRGFVADMTGSLVATWLDYRAILNASLQIGNPYRGASVGYEVNTGAVPPLDTPIHLVVEPARREK